MPALSPLKPGHSASFYKYCFINLMKITIRLKQQGRSVNAMASVWRKTRNKFS